MCTDCSKLLAWLAVSLHQGHLHDKSKLCNIYVASHNHSLYTTTKILAYSLILPFSFHCGPNNLAFKNCPIKGTEKNISSHFIGCHPELQPLSKLLFTPPGGVHHIHSHIEHAIIWSEGRVLDQIVAKMEYISHCTLSKRSKGVIKYFSDHELRNTCMQTN